MITRVNGLQHPSEQIFCIVEVSYLEYCKAHLALEKHISIARDNVTMRQF